MLRSIASRQGLQNFYLRIVVYLINQLFTTYSLPSNESLARDLCALAWADNCEAHEGEAFCYPGSYYHIDWKQS